MWASCQFSVWQSDKLNGVFSLSSPLCQICFSKKSHVEEVLLPLKNVMASYFGLHGTQKPTPKHVLTTSYASLPSTIHSCLRLNVNKGVGILAKIIT